MARTNLRERVERELDEELQDLRYGIRRLRRSRGVAVPAILTFALAVAHAILIRPFPYPASDRPLAVWKATPEIDFLAGADIRFCAVVVGVFALAAYLPVRAITRSDAARALRAD